ncbi:hypothetical protein [Solemya velum gill symbiont]|uniref:hypothetical protein n=1 Tax=Solemya velum gill symbiont TaxID=2340 RepID=UPI00277B56FC|nr:hypothetical protein [Solemya velum gill symbiont]
MMAKPFSEIGNDAIQSKGWLAAHKWLILRRVSQLGVLALFLLGPLAGIWIIKGNLSSSLLFDTVPMTEPVVFLQMLATGLVPATDAITWCCHCCRFLFSGWWPGVLLMGLSREHDH